MSRFDQSFPTVILGIIVTGIVFSTASCTKRNPLYCDAQTRCGAGQLCDLDQSRCVDEDAPTYDGGNDVSSTKGNKSPGDVCAIGTECQSGICETRCCVSTCSDCHRCDGEGRCEPLGKGPAPQGHCSGDNACGAGFCDETSSCTYQPIDTLCSKQCLDGVLTIERCDQYHECHPSMTSCTPYRCSADGKTCLERCRDHDDCHNTSVCDRRAASIDGKGVCIDSMFVAVLSSNESITEVLLDETRLQGKTHLRIPEGTYDHIVVPPNKTIALVGVGNVIVQHAGKSTGTATITLNKLSNVVLQGITVRGKSSDVSHGIVCQTGALELYESLIEKHTQVGILAEHCDVVLHRNTIQYNRGGGLSLSDGAFDITNNLIVKNGYCDGVVTPTSVSCIPLSSSTIGGVRLAPMNNATQFRFNIIADNQIGPTETLSGGILCAEPIAIQHSILWNNIASKTELQHSGCTFTTSIVDEFPAPNGIGNKNDDPQWGADYRPSSKSPSIDPIGLSLSCVIDHDNVLRDAWPDIGAFEYTP